jgi:hypothetical protein
MAHSPCFTLPLLVSSLYPLLLTWNPPSCDRNRPPQSQVACKLTPLVPHLAPVPSPPKFQPLLGFPGPNVHLIRVTLRTQPSCSCTVLKISKLKNVNHFLDEVISKRRIIFLDSGGRVRTAVSHTHTQA